MVMALENILQKGSYRVGPLSSKVRVHSLCIAGKKKRSGTVPDKNKRDLQKLSRFEIDVQTSKFSHLESK